jgi:hypothetical protein
VSSRPAVDITKSPLTVGPASIPDLRGRAGSRSVDSAGESTFDPAVPPEKQFVTYRTRAGELKTVTSEFGPRGRVSQRGGHR